MLTYLSLAFTFALGFLSGRVTRIWSKVEPQITGPVPVKLDAGNAVDIAFRLHDEAENIDQVLVLIRTKDKRSLSMDNGLTATDAKEMAMSFHSWVDQCLGREMERQN